MRMRGRVQWVKKVIDCISSQHIEIVCVAHTVQCQPVSLLLNFSYDLLFCVSHGTD